MCNIGSLTRLGAKVSVSTQATDEDTHRLKAEHRRFRPASAELREAVRIVLVKEPILKPDYDKAMAAGVMPEAEAENLRIKGGVLSERPILVEIRRP
ncbi:MAG: hypothetical protein L0241_27150 [Planctomycetia bacterium]|nr:hypothetical protein [Planctomycetia bacterium]